MGAAGASWVEDIIFEEGHLGVFLSGLIDKIEFSDRAKRFPPWHPKNLDKYLLREGIAHMHPKTIILQTATPLLNAPTAALPQRQLSAPDGYLNR
jgi:hypothetical protein